jgi:nitrate/nitrite transporter NarK
MKPEWCLLPFVCMLLFVSDLASLNLSQLKKTESLTKLKKRKKKKSPDRWTTQTSWFTGFYQFCTGSHIFFSICLPYGFKN